MSRASKWASEFEQTQQARPARFTTIPSDRLGRKVSAAVGDRGQVEIRIGDILYLLDADVFLDLCIWGIATFGEEP